MSSCGQSASPLSSVLTVLACVLAACSSGPYDAPPPTPDAALFAQQAYPVLLRDCGFAACHGNHERFFRVMGPGRVRLSPTMDAFEPATAEELQISYDRARSMLRADAPGDSLLLRKPLEPSAGGVGHHGLDELGRDVYLTSSAPGLQVLRAWARQSAAAFANGAAP